MIPQPEPRNWYREYIAREIPPDMVYTRLYQEELKEINHRRLWRLAKYGT